MLPCRRRVDVTTLTRPHMMSYDTNFSTDHPSCDPDLVRAYLDGDAITPHPSADVMILTTDVMILTTDMMILTTDVMIMTTDVMIMTSDVMIMTTDVMIMTTDVMIFFKRISGSHTAYAKKWSPLGVLTNI